MQAFLEHIDLWAEALSCLTAMLIAFGGFYAYSKTHKSRHAVFGLAFLMIAFGTILLTFFDWIAVLGVTSIPFRGVFYIDYSLGVILFVSMCAVLAGFLTLIMITENITNPKEVILLYLIAPLSAWVAHEFYSAYHLMLLVLSVLLFIHFWRSHNENPSTNTLFVSLAFGVLVLAQTVLMLSFAGVIFYVTGHALRGISFAILFLTLVSLFISTKPKKDKHILSKKSARS